jgi:hypothetical protein
MDSWEFNLKFYKKTQFKKLRVDNFFPKILEKLKEKFLSIFHSSSQIFLKFFKVIKPWTTLSRFRLPSHLKHFPLALINYSWQWFWWVLNYLTHLKLLVTDLNFHLTSLNCSHLLFNYFLLQLLHRE